MPTHPKAQTSGLVVRTVGEELLVYDLEQHRAHSLNRVASAVWRRCDGTRTAGEIAVHIRDTEALSVGEETVRYALVRLGRTGLLLEPVAETGVSRRELIHRLGAAATVALPLVTSIVVPWPAQAQSCLDLGDPCTSGSQCCAGQCAQVGCACVPGVNFCELS